MGGNDSHPETKRKQAFLKWQASTKGYVLEKHSDYAEGFSIWSLETAKHLALVALAGLAGVFAMVGNNKFDPEKAVWPSGLFAVAIMLCLFGMYSAAQWRYHMANHQVHLLARLDRNELISQKDHIKPHKVRIWKRIGIASGWASLVFILIGGVSLFHQLGMRSP